MSSLLLFALVIVGSLVSSLTGLGGGTLILAGLLLVYPPEIAIPLHSFTQLSSNALRTGLFFNKVNWKVVGAYASLMIPGAFLGARIFDLINPSWLKVIVGILILISLYPFSFRPKGEPRLGTFSILGVVSGFLGVFVGAVGPLVTPFFNRLKMPREGMISTKSAGQALLQISKIIAFWGATSVDFGSLKDNAFILILGTLIGVGISIPISKKISDKKFNMMVDVLLGVIALKVLVEGVRELFF